MSFSDLPPFDSEWSEYIAEGLGPAPECVFCGATETRWYALFGTLLSTSQVYCTRCRTVFEALKDSAMFRGEDDS
ncbi:MAG: PaaD-like zinc ribbon domain-containing protein [bacterium JZ-2024 1]